MKKLGVILISLFFISLAIVSAQSSNSSLPDTDKVNLAYQCLTDQIKARDSSQISLQDAIFSILAVGSDSKLTDAIEREKGSDCWPRSSCTLKDTAQVFLAYNRIGKSTQNIKDYLISKNGTVTELSWSLVIDISNHVASSCKITYSGSEKTINIGEDMKISGNPGTCLSVDPSGFWLNVRDNCLDKKYEISCDQDFITTLWYQRAGSNTVYISPNTHSSSSSGTTSESINAACFKKGNVCDYEGTLWSVIALQKVGIDVSPYVPYLLASASENQNVLPSSVLYLLTGGDDQYNDLVQLQKSGKFWEAQNTKYNKFYDTALALLALQKTSAAEAESAKSYLLGIQTSQGCWNSNNIRDTAFILYAGWSRAGSSGGSGGASIEFCDAAGFSCQSVLGCSNSGGDVLNNYYCSNVGSVCCSKSSQQQSCSSQKGNVCGASQECSGTVIPSLEGSCCLGACTERTVENICEKFNGICSSSCDSTQDQTSDSCSDSSQVCCVPKQQASKSNLLWWIILLVVLIALVALGIIYRKKLQLWWFKFRNKGGSKSSPIMSRRPPFPPATFQRQYPMRRPAPQQRQQNSRDKEMDDVLKKLKEMSS